MPKKLTLNELLDKFKSIHGNRYKYPFINVECFKSNSKITIECSEHGLFEQTVNAHMSKKGCKKCALKYTANLNRLNYADVVIKANKKHHNLYEYFYVEEIFTNKNNIGIICNKHGEFTQTINNHLNGSGCPKCRKTGISKSEIEIQKYIKELGFEIKINNRAIIKPLELDIFIPELNKAIEFNGMYWHYDTDNIICKPKGYHSMKSNLCRKQGIRLLHIREDLWIRDKERMKKVINKFIEYVN